ncbi:MAG TPA: SLC13 family permease [Jatrophihabitans sp.]|uniref:SLC13 family permease n=1 Tax=Jatrophihabitans sp. TaxID=1932789 RepID=UPI002DFCA1C8|nr:SLC13 family permease [Jatrophihabitans sp.]
MPGAAAEVVAAALLLLSLAFAVARPRGLSEAVVAVPAALLVVLLGIVPGHAALQTLKQIGPTVGFLAAILVFGHLCAEAGVFDYLGARAARASGGRPTRLLALVVALAATVTATLTLDATVVLLTPVVLTTTARLRVRTRPHAYACTRLANSGSLLLPVSNLTNLLAFSASGLSFGHFTALMVLPWVLVCVAEWLGLRLFFRRDLAAEPSADRPAPDVPRAPTYALVVLMVTIALFVIASSLDVNPAWAALTGCVALLVPRLRHGEVHVRQLAIEASPGFCLFVLALAVVVDGVARHGLASGLAHLVPAGTTFLELLGLTAVAAVLANVVNNLPATLALIPLVAANPAWVLAVLIGVNIGPNATYPGSLATLLWRRLLPAEDKPKAAEFHLLGAITVPLLLVLAVAALWLGVRTVGV